MTNICESLDSSQSEWNQILIKFSNTSDILSIVMELKSCF
jgi:hypothetical protein